MQKRYLELLTRTDLNEAERGAATTTLRTLVLITILGSAVTFITALLGGFVYDLRLPIGVLLAISLICYALLLKGWLLPSQVFLPSALLVGITYIAAAAYGLHDESMIAYAFIVVLAHLTLGQRAAFLFTGLIIITVFAMGFAEMIGLIVSPTSHLAEPTSPLTISIMVLATAFAQRTLANLLNQNVRRAQENEQKQAEINTRLQALQNELEQRVAERTAELDAANKRNRRRADQFRAVADVSRVIALTSTVEELLPTITNVVSQQFGFYHVGILLTDANNEYAVLRAASSEGGKRMLEHGYQLKIGEQGIVGYVTQSGQPRISLDVGTDAVYFNNPDLPQTRSECALPLVIAGNIIGALDVQSMEPNAFLTDDVEVLSILADQVALAIQNARLFEQTQESLNEAEAVYRQYVRETWTQLPQEQKLAGFRYSAAGVTPLDETGHESTPPLSPAQENGDKREVVVPIILRDEKIGELIVQVPGHGRIKSDHMDVIKAVAERVALSVENARLFEETTRRAERERLVSDITTKIRGTNNPQDMIRTAMEELQKALGATRVEIVPHKSSIISDK